MSLYKQAIREGWTFPSNQGILGIVQLAQLPLTSSTPNRASLDDVAVRIYEETTKQATISFVNAKTTDNTPNLKLELVKDLITTIEAENAAKLNAKATKSHNELIDNLIATKQVESLSSKSIEELQAMKKQ